MHGHFRDFLVDGRPCDVTIDEEGVSWDHGRHLLGSGGGARRSSFVLSWWCHERPWYDKGHNKRHMLRFEDIIGLEKVTPGSPGCTYGVELFTFRRGPSGLQGYQWFPLRISVTARSKKEAEDLFVAVSAGIAASFASMQRPRRLLVIINPLSGRGQACNVFRSIVLPVLRCARIATRVVVTSGSGHATEIVRDIVSNQLSSNRLAEHDDLERSHVSDHDDDSIDGIVAVGGDGLFHEVTRGLVSSMEELDLYGMDPLGIRLAHIPCGSTDAVACSLHGSRSAFNAAAHVALGDSTALDVARITISTKPQPVYATCIAAYGFMADVVLASERYRWLLGPLRYDVLGFAKLLANVSYSCRISWREAPKHYSSGMSPGMDAVQTQDDDSYLNTDQDSSNVTLASPAHGFAISSPNENVLGRGEVCVRGCSVCRSAGIASASSASLIAAEAGCVPLRGSLQRSESLAQPLLPLSRAESSSSTPSTSDVRSLEGSFMSIMIIVQPCKSEKTRYGMARHAHLANGVLTLVLVRKCSQLQFLRFLATMSSSGLVKGQLPHVEVIDAVSCRVESLGKDGEAKSCWNIDGELFPWDGVLDAQAMHGALACFARGCEV